MEIIHIAHLYPDLLNLYGDQGNVLTLQKRLLWRGIACDVTPLPLGAKDDLSKFDIFFAGGGQDFEQSLLLEDLKGAKGDAIRREVEKGKTFLCICGGYQMMGNYYETADGKRIPFLGAIDFYTQGGKKRLIGNYAFSFAEGEVVGFENHSGKTYLGKGVFPLGKVLYGGGNNGEDGTEGVRYKNVFGTYSHGPVLPKNPLLADAVLLSAMREKYGTERLAPLDDALENAAHSAMMQKLSE